VSRRIVFPALAAWIVALWVALWGDLTLANVVSGLLVAVVVIAISRPAGSMPVQTITVRPIAVTVYFATFFAALVQSTAIVVREVLTPGSQVDRAIVAIPMHTRSRGIVTLVANSITLTPGTATIDEHEGPDGTITLYIHVLHVKELEHMRASLSLIERRAVRAFGSVEDIAACEAAVHRPVEAEEPST